MRLSRTHRHLLYGVAWLLGFTLLAVVIALMVMPESKGAASRGTMMVYSQIGSILWVCGFVAIFFSWARVDAREHGRPTSFAVAFSVLWLFFNVLSHIAYLFVTRGWREGSLSNLRFICFLLSAVIVWFGLAKFVGSFFWW
jgi:hypothetical protein